MRRVIIGVGILVLGGLAWLYYRSEGPGAGRPPRQRSDALEMRAERGAPDYIPQGERLEFSISGVYENTIPAMQRALARGADTLALDLRMSRDGRLMVFHDERLERVAGVEGAVAERTLSELRQLDVGDQAVMPTLLEVLSRFGSGVGYELELQDGSPGDSYVDALLGLLSDPGLRQKVVVSSVHPWTLWSLESRAPEVRTELVVSERPPVWMRGSLPRRWAVALGIDGVGLPAEQIAPATVAALHAAGLSVTARDIRDGETLKQVREAGVDAATSFFTGFEDLPPQVEPHVVEDRP